MPTDVSLDDLRTPAPDVSLASAREASINPSQPTVDAQAAFGSTSDAGENAAQATGYNAQTGEIDPTSMTASGQMTSITGQDSPLMRRAANEGMLSAGRRGLENSSFAAGASMGAMVDRATPLALQDAQTNFANMRANIDSLNRAAEVSTGRETDVGLANAQMAQQVELFNADATNKMNELNAQLETAVNQQNAEAANRIIEQMNDLNSRAEMLNAELGTNVSLSNAQAENVASLQASGQDADLNRQWLAGSQAVDLENIRGRYQQLISSNAAAGQMYDSYLSGLSTIMQNSDITPDRVAQYVNVMSRQLEGGLEFIDAINVLDLGGEGPAPADAATPAPTGATADDNNPLTVPGATTRPYVHPDDRWGADQRGED